MTGTARPHNPSGFALLIVLWSVVLLSLLATGITAAGRSDVQLAGNLRRAAAAQAAADAGIAAAVFHASDAPGQAWPADGQPHTLPFGRYALTIRIRDEDRKVNPNYAPADLLTALLSASGADPSQAASLAQAIAEWHTANTVEMVAARYRAAGMAAAPTGAPFRSLDELGLVMGMTPGLLARLRPHLSVFAQAPLNFEQADPVVQAAVRALGTGNPPAPAAAPPLVVDITCEAQGRDGSRFVRHAIVELQQDETGRLFQTLSWDAPPE